MGGSGPPCPLPIPCTSSHLDTSGVRFRGKVKWKLIFDGNLLVSTSSTLSQFLWQHPQWSWPDQWNVLFQSSRVSPDLYLKLQTEGGSRRDESFSVRDITWCSHFWWIHRINTKFIWLNPGCFNTSQKKYFSFHLSWKMRPSSFLITTSRSALPALLQLRRAAATDQLTRFHRKLKKKIR